MYSKMNEFIDLVKIKNPNEHEFHHFEGYFCIFFAKKDRFEVFFILFLLDYQLAFQP